MGLEVFDDGNADGPQKLNFDTAMHGAGAVVAPMAGLVVKVLVVDGSKVEEGQPILVMEAMKMEVFLFCCFNL